MNNNNNNNNNNHNNNNIIVDSLLQSLISLTNICVEAYLSLIIAPMLILHERFYSRLNQYLTELIRRCDDVNQLPRWFTANFVTYTRTVLIVPTLVLLSYKCFALASIVIVLVDFGDFLDGVLARYWNSVARDRINTDGKAKLKVKLQPSWHSKARNAAYGGFVDAVCDKVYIVPVWIYMLSTIQQSSVSELWHRLVLVQYGVLLMLITAEGSSGAIRFRAYFTAVGVSAPIIKQGGSGAIGDADEFNSSAVKADHIGKAKQTFEMFGSAMYVLPFVVFKLFGLILLIAAVPLAYESVRRKIKPRVIYVHGGLVGSLDHAILKFWMQAKAMGSKLIVGVETDANSVGAMNALAVYCVDDVVTNVKTVDMHFLSEYNIAYVVCLPKYHQHVQDDVMKAGKCIIINENGIAQAIGRLDDDNAQVMKED